MIKVLQPLLRLFIRLRYPVSMPEDLAQDLGLDISNFLTFSQLIAYLTDPSHRPTTLVRWMPRQEAERIFRSAVRKEIFPQNSLFSYHFKGGWMEFMLQFDEQSRLRRLYILHRALKHKHEIPIAPQK